MIYTNLDTNNMVFEIKNHLKSIINEDYIKSILKTNLKYKLITKKEYKDLLKFYNLKESEWNERYDNWYNLW